MVQLAWNAVTTKVNAQGQVEGTCVGTGMAFDPAFYYYRPTSALAAHGYGPVLLAGAEMILIDKSGKPGITEGAVQFGRAARRRAIPIADASRSPVSLQFLFRPPANGRLRPRLRCGVVPARCGTHQRPTPPTFAGNDKYGAKL